MTSNMSETSSHDAGRAGRLPQSEWEQLQKQVHQRDEHQCVNCGSDGRLEVHHIVPVSAGGENVVSNLVTLCKPCHLAAENKRERNDHTSLKNEKTYQHLCTPAEIRRILDNVRHPLTRAIISLHSYTGIGVGELCNLKLGDYTTSNSVVADEYEISQSDSAALQIVPSRENAEKRTRSHSTTVPIISAVEAEINGWLAIRPDVTPVGEDQLFCGTADRWGAPLTGNMVVHDLKKRTDAPPQAFLNCFKRYAPIDQYCKRYLLSGDRMELENALAETNQEWDSSLIKFVRDRYQSEIYDLHDG